MGVKFTMVDYDDVPESIESIRKRAKRAARPEREARRQAELQRMSVRKVCVPMYTHFANRSEYLGHIWIPVK